MSAPPSVQLVWFKRDLRVADHAALSEAALRGPVVGLYVIEPSLIRAADFDALHWWWVGSSLDDLRSELASRGGQLVVRRGEVVDVLDALSRECTIAALWSHQETGADHTFRRDRAVQQWTQAAGVPWHEFPQHGVVRGLRNRDDWQRHWRDHMETPLCPPPETIEPSPALSTEPIPTADELSLTHLIPAVDCRQPDLVPGEAEAVRVLTSFLHQRGAAYHREMSSPVSAYQSCSRLSPYLAWGNISIRTVVHATREARSAQRQARANKEPGAFPGRALQAFSSRLHWHCHFIQKLEREPAIEFHCFNRAYDGVREPDHDETRLRAWQEGRTGYPFVDACMRALQSRGWINFRMRAMLVSFAAYDLWLDWRRLHPFLARQFVDYEPGIHLSQLQMQSGVTGINTLRIYNPVKQGLDHDPEGVFIREWVPELAGLDTPRLHEPWNGAPVPGYPSRMVEHASAVKEARAKLGAVRRTSFQREEAARVYEKHGSRKRPRTRTTTRKAPKQPARQLELEMKVKQ